MLGLEIDGGSVTNMDTIKGGIMNGDPINKHKGDRIDPMNYTEAEFYWFMYEQGKRRFGSECKHERIKGNRCANCLRKVVTQ